MKPPKRKSSPWFAFYPDDYMGGTRLMTLAARGAFVDLLNHQFLHGQIPTDDRSICRLLGAFPDEWEEIKDEVMDKFTDGKNHRMEKELEERMEIRQRKIDAGRKGAEKRWKNNGTTNGTTNGTANGSAIGLPSSLPMASTSTSTSYSLNENKECPTTSDAEVLKSLWDISPPKSRTRSSKKKVSDEWKRIKKSERPDFEKMISAFRAWLSCEDWTKENGAFVPGLHLWIKNRQWENIPEQTQPFSRIDSENFL